MRQLTAHFQEYFQEQGVDYLSLDSKSQRILERKHTKKYLEWDKNRKITLALQRKGFFNKKGVPLLRARIELYIALPKNEGQPDRKLYEKLERVIAESTAELFFSFTDKEFKKHKSVDLIDSQRIIKEMQRLLKKPSIRNIEYWVLDTRPKCDTLEEVLKERYSLGSRFKRFFTRSASENQIAQLEQRIARLEKHNKTSNKEKLIMHARNKEITRKDYWNHTTVNKGQGVYFLHEIKTFTNCTFDFRKESDPSYPFSLKGTITLASKKFVNCTFIGANFAFSNSVFEGCTFGNQSLRYVFMGDTEVKECDFFIQNNSNIDARSNSVRFHDCWFHNYTKAASNGIKIGAKDLSGSGGLPVEVTDPKGVRRKKLDERLLTVEELASKKSMAKTSSAIRETSTSQKTAQLEQRIARLEKHNKTARTSDFFKKYVHAKDPSVVKIEVLEEAVSKSGYGYVYLIRGKVIFGGFQFFIFRIHGRGNPETILHTKDFKKALLTFDKVASREDIH